MRIGIPTRSIRIAFKPLESERGQGRDSRQPQATPDHGLVALGQIEDRASQHGAEEIAKSGPTVQSPEDARNRSRAEQIHADRGQ